MNALYRKHIEKEGRVMPRPRKCECEQETCFTCHNRHNWERWIARKRGTPSKPCKVSDAELDRRALKMERRRACSV